MRAATEGVVVVPVPNRPHETVSWSFGVPGALSGVVAGEWASIEAMCVSNAVTFKKLRWW